jgi:hypothetical protein
VKNAHTVLSLQTLEKFVGSPDIEREVIAAVRRAKKGEDG